MITSVEQCHKDNIEVYGDHINIITNILAEEGIKTGIIFDGLKEEDIYSEDDIAKIYVGDISAKKALEVLEAFESEGLFPGIIRKELIDSSYKLKSSLLKNYLILKDTDKEAESTIRKFAEQIS